MDVWSTNMVTMKYLLFLDYFPFVCGRHPSTLGMYLLMETLFWGCRWPLRNTIEYGWTLTCRSGVHQFCLSIWQAAQNGISNVVTWAVLCLMVFSQDFPWRYYRDSDTTGTRHGQYCSVLIEDPSLEWIIMCHRGFHLKKKAASWKFIPEIGGSDVSMREILPP